MNRIVSPTAMNHTVAPELQTTQWFNSPKPITLAGLRGRVVLIEAFQMLCPGCVSHGLPQAVRVAENGACGTTGCAAPSIHQGNLLKDLR